MELGAYWHRHRLRFWDNFDVPASDILASEEPINLVDNEELISRVEPKPDELSEDELTRSSYMFNCETSKIFASSRKYACKSRPIPARLLTGPVHFRRRL